MGYRGNLLWTKKSSLDFANGRVFFQDENRNGRLFRNVGNSENQRCITSQKSADPIRPRSKPEITQGVSGCFFTTCKPAAKSGKINASELRLQVYARTLSSCIAVSFSMATVKYNEVFLWPIIHLMTNISSGGTITLVREWQRRGTQIYWTTRYFAGNRPRLPRDIYSHKMWKWKWSWCVLRYCLGILLYRIRTRTCWDSFWSRIRILNLTTRETANEFLLPD
jgi:hypothetical protein